MSIGRTVGQAAFNSDILDPDEETEEETDEERVMKESPRNAGNR